MSAESAAELQQDRETDLRIYGAVADGLYGCLQIPDPATGQFNEILWPTDVPGMEERVERIASSALGITPLTRQAAADKVKKLTKS